MKIKKAIAAFSALAHPARLAVFRRLMRAGPDGLAAGALAAELAIAAPTLSFHLAEIRRSGLARARREGRSIVYAADLAGIAALLDFLKRDCCQGKPERCFPTTRDGKSTTKAKRKNAPRKDALR